MTRKYYDWDEIRRVISEEEPKGLTEAMIGMAEDWSWTADSVWKKEGGYMPAYHIDNPKRDRSRKIYGLNGSDWATPEIKLFYGGEEFSKSKSVYKTKECE